MNVDNRHSRRHFLAGSAALFAGSLLPMSCRSAQPSTSAFAPTTTSSQPLFNISLAQWSLHRMLKSGNLDNLDFPAYTRKTFGIHAVEYVNQFFKDKARDAKYIAELDKRCKDEGVRSMLIMIDDEGDLGHADEKVRAKAIDNHKPWVDAARTLGCHSIRVNADSSGTWEEQQQRCADGLSRLAAYAAPLGLNVIVENHGGLSSNGQWLAGVMKMVNSPRCGTLPDLGNFCFDWSHKDDPKNWYDRYKGVSEMMPWAKAVSAKSYDFDDQGNETTIDYYRMMRIVLGAGYRQYLGIEYEGDRLSEIEGTKATKRLLERVRADLADEFKANG